MADGIAAMDLFVRGPDNLVSFRLLLDADRWATAYDRSYARVQRIYRRMIGKNQITEARL